MDKFEPVVILISFPSDGDVKAFATALVSDGEAACVSVLPEMESVYRWQGVIEYACERQLVVKTTRARVQTLRDHLKTLHPYETPEFLVLPVVDGGDDYLEWIRGAVGERNSGESRHKG